MTVRPKYHHFLQNDAGHGRLGYGQHVGHGWNGGAAGSTRGTGRVKSTSGTNYRRYKLQAVLIITA